MLKTIGNIGSITRSKTGKIKLSSKSGDNSGHNNSNNCGGSSNRKYSSDFHKSKISISLTLMLRTSLSIDSSTSAPQITIEYNEVNGGGGK